MWWLWWICRFTWDEFIILYNPFIIIRLAGKLTCQVLLPMLFALDAVRKQGMAVISAVICYYKIWWIWVYLSYITAFEVGLCVYKKLLCLVIHIYRYQCCGSTMWKKGGAPWVLGACSQDFFVNFSQFRGLFKVFAENRVGWGRLLRPPPWSASGYRVIQCSFVHVTSCKQ